jgi:predicted nucleotidyltransferase
MAEDGIDNYGLAKRKAARALGATESESLPTNDEIEIELRAYQSLYQDDEHPQRLRELRQTALEIMKMLEEFHPYLTGSVLDGTAGRFAEIEIELFSDSGKDVEIFLLSHDISYQIAEASRKNPGAPEIRLRLQSGETSIVLSVFQSLAERQTRRSPHTGKGQVRAKTSTVAELLSS